HTRCLSDWSSDVCSSDLSASEGEERAARWIAERLRSHGCEVQIDEEAAYGHFWRPLFALNALGVAAGVLMRRGRRRLGRALALRSEERRVGKEGRSRRSR